LPVTPAAAVEAPRAFEILRLGLGATDLSASRLADAELTTGIRSVRIDGDPTVR